MKTRRLAIKIFLFAVITIVIAASNVYGSGYGRREADVNARDNSGRTALMEVSDSNDAPIHLDVMQILIDRGADDNGDIHNVASKSTWKNSITQNGR
jgi:hypothetical protein